MAVLDRAAWRYEVALSVGNDRPSGTTSYETLLVPMRGFEGNVDTI